MASQLLKINTAKMELIIFLPTLALPPFQSTAYDCLKDHIKITISREYYVLMSGTLSRMYECSQ